MTTNVCALSIIQGLCAALDTLCSQAYASANPKTTSLHALRTAFLAFLVCIPASVVMWHGERLLLALGQDPIVANLAGSYLKILIIGLPGYTLFEIMRRWLQAQGLMAVPTASLLIASPINIFLNWLLVWGPYVEPTRQAIQLMVACPVRGSVWASSALHSRRLSRSTLWYNTRVCVAMSRLTVHTVPLFGAILHLLCTSRSLGRLHKGHVPRLAPKHRPWPGWLRLCCIGVVGYVGCILL